MAVTVWAPGRFGLQWGDTTRHLATLLVCLAGITLVVGTFRVLGGNVPWDGARARARVEMLEEASVADSQCGLISLPQERRGRR